MGFYKVLFASFCLVFLAELGDKTQLTALALTTSSRTSWAVFLGSSLALVAASAIAVAFGEALNRIPLVQKYLPIASGVLFVLMGLALLVNVARRADAAPAAEPAPAPRARGAVFGFVIGTASRLESEISDYLEALAARVPAGPRRDTLRRLAAEDRTHLHSMRQMQSRHETAVQADPDSIIGAQFAEISARAPRTDRLAARHHVPKPGAEDDIRADIQAAIEIEESTGDFYLALARMAKIHEVRDAFRWLAMEDIRHAQTLCSLINPDGAEGGDAASPDGETVA